MTEPQQLVLIGAPGSGKSTVGLALATRLGLDFVDVDQEIEAQAGKPITEIFVDSGEQGFRALELVATLAALERPGVISLGGGAVTTAEIRAVLAGRRVVWLVVTAATAAQRVGFNVSRPLLLGNVRATLTRLLADRTPLYLELAGVSVATDKAEPGEVVEKILAWLEDERARGELSRGKLE